jgi:hypothetical protein
MLSMLNSVNVLVGKDDTHARIGARVKRTITTMVECISADGRCSSTPFKNGQRGYCFVKML